MGKAGTRRLPGPASNRRTAPNLEPMHRAEQALKLLVRIDASE
jgi:hypothetical protein